MYCTEQIAARCTNAVAAVYAGGCRSFVTASMTWQEALQTLIVDLA